MGMQGRFGAGRFAESRFGAGRFSGLGTGAGPSGDVATSFGARTLAGAGGVPVTGTSVASGDPSGHWQIVGGEISPSPAGVAASLNLAPYSMVLDNDQTVDIATMANALSAGTRPEIIAAVDAAEALDTSVDWEVVVRDGSVIDGDVNNHCRLRGVTGFLGTLVDISAGASEADFDHDAVASWSGGSCKIRPETPLGARMDCVLVFQGCTKIHVDGFNFINHSATASYNHDDGGANTDMAPARLSTHRQITVEANANYPTPPSVILSNNRFGARSVQPDPQFWAYSIFSINAKLLLVEDCFFDGTIQAITASNAVRVVSRRNAIRQQVEDGHFFTSAPSAQRPAGLTDMRIEVTDCAIFDQNDSIMFAGVHTDAIQIGSAADTLDYDIFIKKNHIQLDAASALNAFGYSVLAQGMFLYGGPTQRNGVIAENYVMCSVSGHGITVVPTTSGLDIRNNTVVPPCAVNYPTDTTKTGPLINNYLGNALIEVRDNIACGYAIGASASIGNVETDRALLSGDANSLYDLFEGPFTDVGFGATPTTPIRQDSVANFKADVDANFVPKVGGNAENKGHLTDSTPVAGNPVLTFIDHTVLSHGASVTWAAAPIGAANVNRRVIVSVASGGTNKTLSGISLGGVDMTEIVNVSATGEVWVSGIYYLDVAAGVTADIVVTFLASTFADVFVSVHTVNRTTVGSIVADGAAVNNAGSITGSLNVAANSAGIALGGANSLPTTWTESHEDAAWGTDIALNVGNIKMILSSANAMAADTASDVFWNRSAGTSDLGFAAVVLRPPT